MMMASSSAPGTDDIAPPGALAILVSKTYIITVAVVERVHELHVLLARAGAVHHCVY
jgi:hypothetical protein